MNTAELSVVLEKLEEDLECILRFLASNGLVANKKKAFVLLNKKPDEATQILPV
jgi:hypothetical protein